MIAGRDGNNILIIPMIAMTRSEDGAGYNYLGEHANTWGLGITLVGEDEDGVMYADGAAAIDEFLKAIVVPQSEPQSDAPVAVPMKKARCFRHLIK